MTNFMLVRTSFGDRKRKHYSIVLKRKDILTECKIPTAAESIPYSPEAHLESGEWFKIEGVKGNGINNEIITSFKPSNYNNIKREEFEHIDHMVIVQDDNYYFEKISKRHLISAPTVVFGAKPTIKETNKMLILDGRFDAIYNALSDTLYFKNFGTLTSLFTGVTEYYKEATDEVVKKFLEDDSLEIDKDFNEGKVSKPNRKRIGLLVDRMDSFDTGEKQIISEYILKYVGNIKTNASKDKLIINNDEDLKHVLMGFLERYFTTIVTNEAKLATGVMPI